MKRLVHGIGYMIILSCSTLFAQDTIVITDADLVSGNYHWTKDHIYLLNGEVTLEEGVLEIEAGTLIIGKETPSGVTQPGTSLTISAGAQLFAQGTHEEPIIFTGEKNVHGINWPGIIVNGSQGSTSGAIEYVSIRFAGLSDSLQIGSALTLRNVDKSTGIHHIEVFNSGGDGIRIYGGDVNIAYAAVSYVRDDAFEYSSGWTGNGIYWYANDVGTYSWDPLPDDPGSFAIEGKSFIDEKDTLISNPTIFNASLIGENCGDLSKGTKGAIGLFSNSLGFIANSVFMHYPDYGISVEDVAGSADSYAALQNGALNIVANVWHDFGRANESLAGNQFSGGPGGLILVDSTAENQGGDALIDHLLDHFNLISSFGMLKNLAGTCTAIDPRLDPKNDYSKSPNAAFPNNEFFANFNTPVEKGAFSSELWIKNWTALDQFDSLIKLGEEGYGSYFFKDETLNQTDTIIVSCEDLPDLQDSLYYEFPCRPILYQIGAAHRKGNPRRSRPNTRSDEQEYAFIEEWEYRSNDPNGCSVASELRLTILVFDTVAPIIHPVPDALGGLTAITEDCDESWISSVQVDTLVNGDGILVFRYTFLAQDYSGNQSSLVVELQVGKEALEWYADFDQDGYGNPSIMIVASDSIPGFVQNNRDCNDSDPLTYPGSPGPDQFLMAHYNCDSIPEHHDLCSGAMEIPAGINCTFSFGDMYYANPTIYPDLNQSCLPRNYDDIWVKTVLPPSGGIHVQLEEDIFNLVDPSGFSRVFLAEIYSGNCQNLSFEYCATEAGSKLIFDFEDSTLVGQEIFIRLMEGGNINYTPIQICIIDLAEKVGNDFCSNAHILETQSIDSCTMFTFSNYNAVSADGNVTSDCHSDFAPGDIWFKFIAPEADSFQFIFDTTVASDFVRPIVIFYSGDCDQMTEIACFNYETDSASFSKWLNYNHPGEELFIRLFDDFYAQGEFQLSLCYPPKRTVNVAEINPDESLLIYPNPGSLSQNIQLQFAPLTSSQVQLSILDINGRLMLKEDFANQLTKSISFTLNPSELQSGMYIVRFRTESGIYTKKLLLID